MTSAIFDLGICTPLLTSIFLNTGKECRLTKLFCQLGPAKLDRRAGTFLSFPTTRYAPSALNQTSFVVMSLLQGAPTDLL